MKIPFDIKYRPQIESGEYKVVCGERNFPARIICWDARGVNDKRHIVALSSAKEDTAESILRYYEDGHLISDYARHGTNDLFIITTEEELTPFEQEVSDMVEYCKEHGVHVASSYAKRHTKTLLNLAREQLRPEIDAEIAKAYKNADNTVYENGILYGKAETLKDLPRWREWGNGACCNGQGIPLALVVRGLNGYELVDSLGIPGEKYIMLDELEKLPGFKEDKKWN